MNIALSIRSLRKQHKLTQFEFAKKCCISRDFVSQIERGKSVPSFSSLELMASCFDIPLPVLFWFSVDESDIKPEKKQLYAAAKPVIDNLINEIFSTVEKK